MYIIIIVGSVVLILYYKRINDRNSLFVSTILYSLSFYIDVVVITCSEYLQKFQKLYNKFLALNCSIKP
jgi:hypothetical protein